MTEGPDKVTEPTVVTHAVGVKDVNNMTEGLYQEWKNKKHFLEAL